jgi:hypothetical protein
MARRRRKSGGSISSILGIAAVVLIVVLGGTFLLLKQPPEVDNLTSCPKNDSLSKKTIVLLFDTTEKMTATQEKKIKDVVFQVVDASEIFDRIMIYEVDPAFENLLKPSFNFCKPPKDALGNPVLQKFAKLNFERKLKDIFDNANYERPTSPIIEALGSISASFPLNNSSKHLIIASDFIENSEILNQFESSWISQAQNNKLLEDRRPILDGVKVSMLFIPRSSVQHHDKGFSDWWKNYLKDSGARLVDQEFFDSETGNSYDLYPFIPITG